MCEKGKDFEVYIHNEYECWRTPPGNIGIINYRYLLKKEGNNLLIIIGCNPSTANEMQHDPTMGLVDRFCQRTGYGGYIMLNLYPQIAPNVEALPANNDPQINHINKFIIEKTLKENKNSDILFAFGQLINHRDYLYDPCYVDIRNLVRIYFNKKQIKKLALGDAEGNVVRKFDYPPHFRNQAFWGNGIDRAVVVDFNLETYHIQNHKKTKLSRIQSKKAK
ncbi:MAG: DUF1643 domain-containing protein [Verrucomicrobia bacterium]|jgi:hypothetical protein|nr:DUF1643 domain-containing protein [Verrucomicrobiota bacterium]